MMMLTPSGGATAEPTTPSRAISMSPRRAKMAAGAVGRDAALAAVRDVVIMAFLL
jgi:hypothetical protein